MPYGWKGEVGHYDGGDTKVGHGGGGDKDKEWCKLENKQLVSDEVKEKTKETKETNITIQKLLFNGGIVGECRRQISSVVDNRGSCHGFGGIGHYDSGGGREDHHGHRNERHGSCDLDCDRRCRGGGMMMYKFAIEAEREDSCPEAEREDSRPEVAINDRRSEGKPVDGSSRGGNKFHRAEKLC
uniref:Uncharacterized protein n=1 Tax=Romanomermis culicivorax TaxID=13658 RepID=A0A915HFN2_ROMCU